MSTDILKAVKQHAEAKIAMHQVNVMVYLKNPAGIGEHSDIAEAVECELTKIAHSQDIIDMIEKHFSSEEQLPLFS